MKFYTVQGVFHHVCRNPFISCRLFSMKAAKCVCACLYFKTKLVSSIIGILSLLQQQLIHLLFLRAQKFVLTLNAIHPQSICIKIEKPHGAFWGGDVLPHPVPVGMFFSVSDYSECLRNLPACILQ